MRSKHHCEAPLRGRGDVGAADGGVAELLAIETTPAPLSGLPYFAGEVITPTTPLLLMRYVKLKKKFLKEEKT